MKQFSSYEECFAAVTTMIARLEALGLHGAADEMRSGYGCLNGLTDGWALFLEAIERVWEREKAGLSPADRKALKTLRAEVRRIVHRH